MKNKFATKLLASALALVVAVTAVPVTAMAGTPSYNKEAVYYQTSKNATYTSTTSFTVSNLSSKQTIKKKSVASSNKNVVGLCYLKRNINNSSYKSEYYDSTYDWGKTDGKTVKNSNYSYEIGITLKKAGTSNVTFKIGNKKYTSKIKVCKYTNPVASCEISGISGDLKNKTKSSAYTSTLKLSKNVKNSATIKVKAASGWKINYIELYNHKTSSWQNINTYSKPVPSSTLRVGTLTKGTSYTVYVSFKNTKTGGTIYCNYYLN